MLSREAYKYYHKGFYDRVYADLSLREKIATYKKLYTLKQGVYIDNVRIAYKTVLRDSFWRQNIEATEEQIQEMIYECLHFYIKARLRKELQQNTSRNT